MKRDYYGNTIINKNKYENYNTSEKGRLRTKKQDKKRRKTFYQKYENAEELVLMKKANIAPLITENLVQTVKETYREETKNLMPTMVCLICDAKYHTNDIKTININDINLNVLEAPSTVPSRCKLHYDLSHLHSSFIDLLLSPRSVINTNLDGSIVLHICCNKHRNCYNAL